MAKYEFVDPTNLSEGQKNILIEALEALCKAMDTCLIKELGVKRSRSPKTIKVETP